MNEDQITNDDQYLEEDIKRILHYLKAHKPEKATMKEALRIRTLMQRFAEKLVGTDMEFAELLLKAMQEEKENPEDPDEDSE